MVWDSTVKPKGILGGHLNIRSLFPKRDEIRILLSESNIDFLCISETWLHDKIPTSIIDVPGYTCFRRDRTVGRGGGVLIYIKDTFNAKQMYPTVDMSTECLCINVILSQSMQFHILVVYNPPSACTATLCENLDAMFKNFKHKNEMLVFGDFNINWIDKHCRKKLKNLASKHDFIQMIETPTRITRNTQTLIDVIFANKPDRIIKKYNLVNGLPDHNMILIARKLTKKRMTRFLNPNRYLFKLEIPRKKSLVKSRLNLRMS